MTKTPCFLCAMTPLIPGPRQCPICAGTGYVVTEGLNDPYAPGPGGSDEMFDKPIPYKHPMDPDQ